MDIAQFQMGFSLESRKGYLKKINIEIWLEHLHMRSVLYLGKGAWGKNLGIIIGFRLMPSASGVT